MGTGLLGIGVSVTMLVYFIHATKSNLIKIGITRNLPQRLKSHQAKAPKDPMVVLHTTPGWMDLECSLHVLFADLNVWKPWKGAGVEWFKNDPRIHEAIRQVDDVHYRWKIADTRYRGLIRILVKTTRYYWATKHRFAGWTEDEVLAQIWKEYEEETEFQYPLQDRIAICSHLLATDDPILQEPSKDLDALIQADQDRIMKALGLRVQA